MTLTFNVSGTFTGTPVAYAPAVTAGLQAWHYFGGSDAAGSGLGLAIIKSIAERHGARLTLGESARLKGLEARVTFPLPGAGSTG